jgi:hypothetical protein
MRRKTFRRIALWLSATMLFISMHTGVAAAMALASGSDSIWVEICTGDTTRWVPISLDDAHGPTAPESSADMKAAPDCPLCRITADLPFDPHRADLSFALPAEPPGPPPSTPLPVQAADRVVLTAPARAPPVLSMH